MLKSVSRAISAVVAAAALAGIVTIFPATSEQVSANANSGKGDRLDIRVTATKCSEQAWPYYEASCLKDRRMPLGQAKPVRIVGAERSK